MPAMIIFVIALHSVFVMMMSRRGTHDADADHPHHTHNHDHHHHSTSLAGAYDTVPIGQQSDARSLAQPESVMPSVRTRHRRANASDKQVGETSKRPSGCSMTGFRMTGCS
eukprot:1278573-Rhodomonas_salina.1